MRLTEGDKGRLFLLALIVLGIIVTLLTDSCGAAPADDHGQVILRKTATPVGTVYETPVYTGEDWQHEEVQRREDFEAAVAAQPHEYEWVKTIDNFQFTCPTRILRRDGKDFCLVIKCDTVGVTMSCNW